MDKIKHLALTLDKSQERGYIKVPFQVEKKYGEDRHPLPLSVVSDQQRRELLHFRRTLYH